MIIDPLGSARKKYRKRVEEVKKKAIGELKYAELAALRRGEKIVVRVPIIQLPHLRYGPWAPAVGAGPGEEGEPVFPKQEGEGGRKAGRVGVEAIYEEMTIKDLVNWMKHELDLEMIKPGRRKKEVEKITYPSISKRGTESLLDLDETLDAMIERQIILGEFKPGEKLKISIDEEDLRYRFPKVKYKPYKDATVVYIRDVSGSITKDDLEASYTLTFLVDLWLKEFYPKVERVYIAHNVPAWEETEEGYYNLQSGGGTSFGPAYEIIDNMLKGVDYPRKTQVKRKIDKDEADIYVVQMTDGENFDKEEALSKLRKIMPSLTRFCYLETHLFGEEDTEYIKSLREEYKREIEEGKVRLCTMGKKDDVWKALKVFFGRGGK
jgi:uncharacterized sporulation protein YeaH/YhbH (DUF444 family)